MEAYRSAEHDLARIDFECYRQRNTEVSKDQPIRKALKTPKFILSEAIYCRTEKKLRGAGQVQMRGAHLWQKRFVPDNTCFVDVEIL